MLSALCVFGLLGDEAGDGLPLPTLFEGSLPVEKDSKSFEKLEKLIRLQKILWIFWPSPMDFPVFKEVGFEDHHSLLLHSPFDLRNKVPFEKIEVGNKVILSLPNLIGIEISKDGMDVYPSPFGQLFCFSQTHFREIHRIHIKSMLSKKDCISSFP